MSLTDDDALQWMDAVQKQILTFATKDNRQYTLDIDPFYNADDGKYLQILADDGTLQEAVPAERREACLTDPEFCRRMATLSQEGRLFVRKPGENDLHQIQSTIERSVDNSEYMKIRVGPGRTTYAIEDPPALTEPVAPPLWKYILYPFFFNQIRQYNQEKEYYDQNHERLANERTDYIRNIKDSVSRLNMNDDMAPDQRTQELEAQEASRTAFALRIERVKRHSILRELGASDQLFEKFDRTMEETADSLNEIKRSQFSHEEEEEKYLANFLCRAERKLGQDDYMDMLNEELHTDYRENESDVIKLYRDFSKLQDLAVKIIRENLRQINNYTPTDGEFHRIQQINDSLWNRYIADGLSRMNDNQQAELIDLRDKMTGVRNIAQCTLEGISAKRDALKEMLSPDIREQMARHGEKTAQEFRNNWKEKISMIITAESFQMAMENHMERCEQTGSQELSPMIQAMKRDGIYEAVRSGFKQTEAYKQVENMSDLQLLELLTSPRQLRNLAAKAMGEDVFKQVQREALSDTLEYNNYEEIQEEQERQLEEQVKQIEELQNIQPRQSVHTM